jgi:hypothetical protein
LPLQKEADKLAQEAKSKREQLLAVQSQANDAQALTLETKREAEILRNEAEDAEVRVVSAASMEHSQPSNGYRTQSDSDPSYGMGQGKSYYSQPSSPPAQDGFNGQPLGGNSGGYGAPPPAQSGGYGAPPPVQGGYDDQSFGANSGGYNNAVMGGGGGMDIPTPSGNDDPYSNPFGE